MVIEELDLESIITSLGSGALTAMICRILLQSIHKLQRQQAIVEIRLGSTEREVADAARSISDLYKQQAILDIRLKTIESVVQIVGRIEERRPVNGGSAFLNSSM